MINITIFISKGKTFKGKIKLKFQELTIKLCLLKSQQKIERERDYHSSLTISKEINNKQFPATVFYRTTISNGDKNEFRDLIL